MVLPPAVLPEEAVKVPSGLPLAGSGGGEHSRAAVGLQVLAAVVDGRAVRALRALPQARLGRPAAAPLSRHEGALLLRRHRRVLLHLLDLLERGPAAAVPPEVLRAEHVARVHGALLGVARLPRDGALHEPQHGRALGHGRRRRRRRHEVQKVRRQRHLRHPAAPAARARGPVLRLIVAGLRPVPDVGAGAVVRVHAQRPGLRRAARGVVVVEAVAAAALLEIEGRGRQELARQWQVQLVAAAALAGRRLPLDQRRALHRDGPRRR
mmetsp:Transcript_5683/g.15927  ORF Transcript_5683/g.15927 Transcript_5683/m.15927 type:complete len:266 (+) Transcript_5683:1580-2377(+)